MRKALVLILLALIVGGCARSTASSGSPEWIKKLIARYESEPVGNPSQSIWQYEFKGQTVYHVPPQCCDMFGTLYDANGNVICAPDGGITGRGDGKCPDFSKEAKNRTLIWQDGRKR